MSERYECQNCGRRWGLEELNPVEDVLERVAPGEPMPAGECPGNSCVGAVCHKAEMPSDLEEKNEERAGWAAIAVQAFMDKTGSELEYAVGDLLCDLRHFCDYHGIDFDDENANGRGHYEAETDPTGRLL